MKKLNTFTKSLFTVTLFAALGATTVSASELTTAQQLQANAKHSLTVTLEENLNQVVSTINGDLIKDTLLAVTNTQSLVLKLAASQSVKDDKIISAVSE